MNSATPKYSFRFSDKSTPEVVIDLGDGFAEAVNEQNLIAVVEMVKKRKWKYRTQDEWKEMLAIYEGALEFLKASVSLERR